MSSVTASSLSTAGPASAITAARMAEVDASARLGGAIGRVGAEHPAEGGFENAAGAL